MADLAVTLDDGELDLSLDQTGTDLASDGGLETGVLLSLELDRRAEPTDALPGGSDDLRGWWGDEFAEVAGDRIGSRLWLLERAAATPDIPAAAERYLAEALQWMLDDGVADAVEPSAELA